jgi:tetratricopeptide (TPR) repeat protein
MPDKPNEAEAIFMAALEIETSAERSVYVNATCGTDARLLARVQALLDAHDRSGSFLEKPPAELAGTIVWDPSGASRTESLKAGLATAFGEDHAVVIGDGNHSVLKMLGNTLGEVPRVSLRESEAEGEDPIARPNSPEMPDRDSDSRYRLDGEIARGGMGAIIKGRDTDLGRDLAIKVLLDSHKDKPEVIQRFVEEAQIGGQLQHPGIAPIYELGQFCDKRPFFAMKLVKGQTLSKLLGDRQNAADVRGKFVGIFEQVCQTMAYAHSRGVIHRDLKPANIMVGAFGEVQVMDWGLAKVLQVGGVADEKKSQSLQQGQSIIQTLRSGVGSDVPGSFRSAGSETQMGTVMGTPAYMPPEQALGEIDNLDERADVFGLGAILCEILTGKPPYVAEDGTRVLHMASRGKLENAFERLDACGADAELITLTRHCLELEPGGRPRDAGELAERITGYLESVETKLRETELQRAAEAARVVEERKRARVTMALAASMLLTLGLGGGGWMWLQQQQAERRTVATAKVNEVLEEVRLHQQLAEAANGEEEGALDVKVRELTQALSKARDALELAEQEDIDSTLQGTAAELLTDLEQETNEVRELAAQVAADRAFQEDLESIRLSQTGGEDEEWSNIRVSAPDDSKGQARSGEAFDIASADELYEKVFQSRGVDVTVLPTEVAVARVRQSRIRESLITAMDNWVRALPTKPDDGNETRLLPVPAEGDTRSKLLAIIHQADDSQWRKKLRGALVAEDFGRLKELAEADEVQQQPAELIAWLGAALRDAGQYDTSVAVLRQVHQQKPDDFWLNHELSQSLSRGEQTLEGLGYARAALSLRPQSSGAWWGLAVSLRIAERFDEAIPAYRTAIELDPKNVRARQGLGFTLYRQRKLDEALDEYHTAIEIDPKYAKLHSDLGFILSEQGKLDEAIDAYEKAIELDPKFSGAYDHLGIVLEKHNKVEEAIAAHRKAIELDGTQDSPHNNLGILLEKHGQVDEAIVEYRRAIELDPDQDYSHGNLGNALEKQGKLDEAIAEYRRAIKLNPQCDFAHCGLGWALCQQGKLDEAMDACRTAIELKPKFPHPHVNLGNALMQKGRLDEAIVEYRTAIELDPEFTIAHINLGDALRRQGEHDLAVAEYRTAIEFEPENIHAHSKLGDALLAQNQFDEAIDEYKKSIEIDPNSLTAHIDLGMALAQSGQLDEGIAEIQRVVEVDPKYSTVFTRLGGELSNAGHLDEALSVLRIAIERNPTDSTPLRFLGITLQKHGRADEAVSALRSAVEIDPNDPAAEMLHRLLEK